MWKYVILSVLLGVSSANSQEVTNHNFDNLGWSNLAHGSYWSIQSSGGVNNSPYARLTYSVSGTAGKELQAPLLSLNTNVVWIEANIRAVGSLSGGSKFIKIFGEDPGGVSWNNYNNLTLGLDYNSNTNRGVSYWIDTDCVAYWGGTTGGTCDSPTFNTTTSPIDVRGTTWNHYKAYVKRADPGVKNGEIKVWLNGVLREYITGMDSNPNHAKTSTRLKNIEFGGYNHDNFNGTVWYLDVDNVYVGTTEKDSVAVNGQCGPAHGETFSELSSDNPNLCSQGTVGTFAGDGPWNWPCLGISGGADVNCTAFYEEPTADESGICGAADGGNFSDLAETDPSLCLKGTVSSWTVDLDGWLWMCDGVGEGTSDPCTADKIMFEGGGVIRASLY